MTEYSVFISYRRDGGDAFALLLYDRLSAMGYKVFIDVESLRAGKFNEALLEVIDNCKDFILILSKDALDRCVNEDDWVRREVSHAMKKKKNIVPIMHRDFSFPEVLPDDIKEISNYQAIKANGTDMFPHVMEKLSRYLVSERTRSDMGKNEGKSGSISDAPPALTTIPTAVDLIGRENDIRAIQELLDNNDIVAIRADGGVGKTAIAAKIANQIKKDVMSGSSNYQHVAWITSTGSLKEDLIGMEIPSVINAQSQEEKYQAVSAFLQSTPTFLIIDNMDELPSDEEIDYLNTIAGKTKILITTRAEIPKAEYTYDLSEIDEDSALILFYSHYRKGRKFTINQIREQVDVSVIKKIITVTRRNALLIELIGKMVYANHWILDDLCYRLETDVFGQDSKNLIQIVHRKSHHRNKDSMLEQIQNLYEMSSLSDRQKEIMSFIALFPAEHSIFFDVFEWAGFEDDDVDNLGELERRGWIERGEEGYLIHTIVKESVEQQGKAFFDEDKHERLIKKLTDTKQYKSVDMGYTVIRERIIVPETICRLLVKQESEKLITSALLHNIAGVYYALGDYAEALKYYQKALAICEKVLGGEHLDTATMYNNIAGVYHAQGDCAETLKYYRKALAIREKVLGPEHPDTATTYDNLAVVYCNQRDYAVALEYHQKALAIREKVLGPEHPDTATTYNNLAGLYLAQGDYTEALKYYEQALAIREKVLGPEHPDTTRTYDNLAVMYSEQGDYAEAMKYYRKALAIREKVFGLEHPDNARTYNNLAGVYSIQGDYAEALKYYQKALAIREKVLGPEHPDTATTYDHLAGMYRNQGSYAEALKHYRKALAIREKVLGPEHPDTASTYDHLAVVYRNQGDYAEALKYFRKALAIREKVLGPEHPDTATMYNNLAVVYSDQGSYGEALKYQQKALAIREKVLGPEHPHTVATYNNLAGMYSDQGNYAEALMYYEKALAIREKVLGPEHPFTKETKRNLMFVKKELNVHKHRLFWPFFHF